jgi:hypothetical protein
MLLYREHRPRGNESREWEEDKHPRVPAGESGGGQFSDGGGDGGSSSPDEQRPEQPAQESQPGGSQDGRGSAAKPSGPYTHGSAKDAKGRRDVAAVFRLNAAHTAAFNQVGWTPLTFHELTAKGADRFHTAIKAAKDASTHGAAVALYSAADYKSMRLFLTPDGKAGFALKGDDIVSVFKHPDSAAKGFANSALTLATQAGGRRLDAFDTVLPTLYAHNGFRAVARIPFDDRFAPEGWDAKTFAGFNGGRPDVVFMVYDPQHPGSYKPGQGATVASYDLGTAAQTGALAKLDQAHEARRPDQAELPAPTPTSALTQMELWPGLFPPVPAPKKKTELTDFSKDHVDLGAFRTKPETAQKFLEQWDERIGVAPAEFKKSFLGGLDGTMNVNFQEYGDLGTLEIKGKLQDGRGTDIARYSRNINLDQNTAESGYFAFDSRSQQSKGLGKQMLKGNVETYQQLGLDQVEVHADIDVGGYAWAKYGYVPTDSSWRSLSRDIRDKIDEHAGGHMAESWDELSSDQQDEIKDAWKGDTFDDYYASEVENWHDSGQSLDDAKVILADEFKPDAKWATDALAVLRTEDHDLPPNEDILNSVSVEYSGGYEGRRDPDITIGHTGLTNEQHDAVEHALTGAFNRQADNNSQSMDPPADLRDRVSEYQDEAWNNMRDRDKYSWAFAHDKVPTGEGAGNIDPDEADTLRELADSDDPKAVWAIADSEHGKDVLLGTDWNGVLDLNDSETMERFNAYVGR